MMFCQITCLFKYITQYVTLIVIYFTYKQPRKIRRYRMVGILEASNLDGIFL